MARESGAGDVNLTCGQLVLSIWCLLLQCAEHMRVGWVMTWRDLSSVHGRHALAATGNSRLLRALQHSPRTLASCAHSCPGSNHPRRSQNRCLFSGRQRARSYSGTPLQTRHCSYPPQHHRLLVRAGQTAVGAMASQQQQIIDTIFSMKRKLLRGSDCTCFVASEPALYLD